MSKVGIADAPPLTDSTFHAQPTFKLVRKGSVLAEMTGADKNTLRTYLQQHAQ